MKYRNRSFNPFSICSNDALHPGVEGGAGLLHSGLVQGVHLLHDGGHQRLLGVMGKSIGP